MTTPCAACPWTQKGQPDIDDNHRSIAEAGGWFCCHVNMGTCYGAQGVHRKAQRRTLVSIAQSNGEAAMAKETQMQFLRANARWPNGMVFSTARRGDKWWKGVAPGDVVELMETESAKSLGHATIIAKNLKTFKQVCSDAAADQNHALPLDSKMNAVDASKMLETDLQKAYGNELKAEEPFTVVHLMVHNPAA